MEVESVPVKRARKADGVAAKALVEAAANAALAEAARAERERVRKMSEEFEKEMSAVRPLTRYELRRQNEQREKFISESWERFRDNWFYGGFPYDAVSKLLPPNYYSAASSVFIFLGWYISCSLEE